MFEKKDFYCAVCYYHGTCLTKSGYIWLANDAKQALEIAEVSFAKVVYAPKRIEILPINAERYSGAKPILTKDYENK